MMMRSALLAAALLVAGPFAAQADGPVDTLAALYQRLSACWSPPDIDAGRLRVRVTVSVAFRRDGSVLGEPRIAFGASVPPDDVRLAYRDAIAETLARCTPLDLTDSMGRAVAGRPLRLTIDDRRLIPA